MIRGHLTQSGPKSNLGRTVRGHLDVGSLRLPRSPDWPESWTDSVSVHCESHSVASFWYEVLWEAQLSQYQKSWISGRT